VGIAANATLADEWMTALGVCRTGLPALLAILGLGSNITAKESADEAASKSTQNLTSGRSAGRISG
jgi:hypothetical protein